MKILIIDDDIAWTSWLRSRFDIVTNDASVLVDFAIVAEKYLCRPKVPFIVVTDDWTKDAETKARKLGAKAYVKREYDEQKLRGYFEH